MQPKDRSTLIKILGQIYEKAESELLFNSGYQLLVAVMLSAQCTDKKVNQVTPLLFKDFPDFEALSKARISQIETIIRPVNYYKTKSKHLIEAAKMVLKEFKGKIPKTHEDICKLPGVGRKTANVVLGELGYVKTLPVDTHVLRLSNRLGLSNGKTPDAVERDLCRLFEPDLWRMLHHSLILHGRRVCKAQNPLCHSCRLSEICPSSKTKDQ